MEKFILILSSFILGILFNMIGEADGTWENMSTLSWIGLGLINMSILYFPIEYIVLKVIQLFKK